MMSNMSGEKLYLKEEMDRSVLIQRLSRPIGRFNQFSFGGGGLRNGGLSDETIDLLKDVFSFDYMGAAQFEWGAVPAALRFIYEEAQKSQVISGQHNEVFYICPITYEQGVQKVIDSLLTDEQSMHLLEYCGLKDAVGPINRMSQREIVGWLELNNGFFMFTDTEMFENTKRLFGR